ncbi:MAG: FkbM family methyltransferase [Verrucomicrobiota bacterium]|jgi:FkbM family methyltransferase
MRTMLDERLRATARKTIPKSLYRRLAHGWSFVQIVKTEGWAVARSLTTFDNHEQMLSLKSLRHPIKFRRTSSHSSAIVNNIIRGEYSRFRCAPPKVIVDAGAFIGDLTCKRATDWPDASIIALEPNDTNFTYASVNVAPYGKRIQLTHRGLWSSPGKLRVTGDADTACATPDPHGEIDAVDVPTLMCDYALHSIDILKLDIEGCEASVLSHRCLPWIRHVQLLIVEFHGPGIETEVTALLQANGFQPYPYRSLTYFFRRPGT